MKASDNFMEKYQPLRFLHLTIECLSTILDKKKIAKLQEYRDSKHKELQDIVAHDDGAPLNLKH